jgi:hypothetical protein
MQSGDLGILRRFTNCGLYCTAIRYLPYSLARAIFTIEQRDGNMEGDGADELTTGEWTDLWLIMTMVISQMRKLHELIIMDSTFHISRSSDPMS